ncbi:MAG: hypothetical protein O3A85_10925 [Proteobacteria bacterium]|nr:hypothetical protein [Pseudomonadota bacterium]
MKQITQTFFAAAIVIALLAGAVAAIPAGPSLAQEAGLFFKDIDDLPLMPGLVEDAGSGTTFDSAQGRLVEAYATGPVSEGEVMAFYDKTLPQLGWQRIDVGVFRRESEILKLEFPGGPGAATPLTVGFRLMPAGS